MIDERTEENASLYVLGLLEGEEARRFESELASNPEVAQFVADLEKVAALLAHSAAPRTPPAAIKARLLEQIRSEKIVPLPVRSSADWLPWAVAACLALLAGALGFNNSRLQKQLSAERHRDELAQIRIATLDSMLQGAPKGVAVVAWDGARQEGIIKVQNMPRPKEDQDYQLWVFDPQYQLPVNGGVVRTNDEGRASFKPDQQVSSVDKFAVTLERKGGVPQHKGPIVLISN